MDGKSFKELYELPCEGHVEEKNNLAYLSWAYAWATLLGQDPTAVKKVYETPDGSLVWKDPIGCHVKVSVTAFGIERIEYLPVMDYRNISVPFEKADSMIVNKTIQRAVTKAIAQFGIGLKLYAGEDMPTNGEAEEGVEPKPQTPTYSAAANKQVPPKEAGSDKLKEKMAQLNAGQTLAVVEWCVKKYGKRPEELTDVKQQADLITKIVSAKYKADQKISDDNMPF